MMKLFHKKTEKSEDPAPRKSLVGSLLARLKKPENPAPQKSLIGSLLARLKKKESKAPLASGLVELRCRGKRIRIFTMDSAEKELTIGKAADNDQHLPDMDCSSGQHHARLHLVAGGVKITACPGCRIHFRGEALSEAILKNNDRVSLGDSELIVKPSGTSERRPCDVHRLEVSGGGKNGEMIRLEKSPFRIGSAPDNDLVLKSDVISRHHAEIRIAENGETWLKDLRSSNGTFVNGEQLERQERMLMDSDEISIACFDYRFLDRNVVHARAQFGKKMLIMGGAIFLALLVFGMFYLVSPTTETVINAVDFYLRRNDYDTAERILSKMPDSRGFQRYEKQYQEYREQIPHYRRTWESVLQYQEFLSQEDWDSAADCFGKLELTESTAWNQADPATAPKQKEIAHSKYLLDLLLSMRALGSSLNTTIEDLENFWDRISGFRENFADMAGHDLDYLQPLYRNLGEQIKKMEFDIKSILEIKAQMKTLAENVDSAQLETFCQFLEKRRHEVSAIVRVRIRDLMLRLQVIQENMKGLDANDQALFDLRLDDVRLVELISSDDCVEMPQLYQLRMGLERRQMNQFRSLEDWKGMQKGLSRYKLDPGHIPEEVTLFSDEKRMEKIIADVTVSQKDMAEYDRVFGERYFYEVLQQTVHSTTNIYASDLIPDLKELPMSILLKDLYRGVSETLVWFRLPRNQWLLHGRMKETRDYYSRILDTRENVLRVFERIAARHQNNRKYFIAKTAYFFFAPPTRAGISDQMLRFSEEWRKFRLKQQSLLEQYSPMDEQKTRKMRNVIIENGIPGDPVFNWVRSIK